MISALTFSPSVSTRYVAQKPKFRGDEPSKSLTKDEVARFMQHRPIDGDGANEVRAKLELGPHTFDLEGFRRADDSTFTLLVHQGPKEAQKFVASFKLSPSGQITDHNFDTKGQFAPHLDDPLPFFRAIITKLLKPKK